jgi:hypothetical protein
MVDHPQRQAANNSLLLPTNMLSNSLSSSKLGYIFTAKSNKAQRNGGKIMEYLLVEDGG